jgi:uncharacterized alkaline shock family protein YloU
MSVNRSAGKTTLSADVLLTIARQSALEVEGVSGMAPVRGGVNSLFGRSTEGVRMTVEDSNVFVDLYLLVEKDVNLREISRMVQQKVARSIAEMTGLDVGHVNIHIEDINYPSEV